MPARSERRGYLAFSAPAERWYNRGPRQERRPVRGTGGRVVERTLDTEERRTHAGAGEPPSTCAMCGTSADDEASVLTWTLDVRDDDTWEWICPECSRVHLRDIEARLRHEEW